MVSTCCNSNRKLIGVLHFQTMTPQLFVILAYRPGHLPPPTVGSHSALTVNIVRGPLLTDTPVCLQTVASKVSLLWACTMSCLYCCTLHVRSCIILRALSKLEGTPAMNLSLYSPVLALWYPDGVRQVGRHAGHRITQVEMIWAGEHDAVVLLVEVQLHDPFACQPSVHQLHARHADVGRA